MVFFLEDILTNSRISLGPKPSAYCVFRIVESNFSRISLSINSINRFRIGQVFFLSHGRNNILTYI